MRAELIIVDKPEALREVENYLQDKEFVAYDCETTGLKRSDEIVGFSICADLDKAYYVVLSEFNRNTQTLEPRIPINCVLPLISVLKSKKLIMHNAIFDCSMAEAFFKIRLIEALHTDTMLLAHLLDENRRIGLKELAKTMWGEDAAQEQKEMQASVLEAQGSYTKANKEMYKADYRLLGKYGAKDAWLTYRLFIELVPKLCEEGLDVFFYEDETMPLLKGPTYELNTGGLMIDQKALLALKNTLKAECLIAKEFIKDETAPLVSEKYTTKAFNIGSSSQLAWLLFGRLDLEFHTLTKEGKTVCKAMGYPLPYTKSAKRQFIDACFSTIGHEYVKETKVNSKIKKGKKIREPWHYIACDKETLAKYSSKYKWIEKLIEYNKKMKLLNTYVEGIEERMQYGIIRPSFLQSGTTSGRYSSRDPNFQNLPRDDKRLKSCIIARPGKVFVGADYSQLEPRVFAYYSKDERLLKAFDGTTDFYSVVGMEVYDKADCVPQKDGSPEAFGVKYKHLRDNAKTIALASTYGATPSQLAKTTRKSLEDTAEDMNNYFETFPGVKKLMEDSHEQAKKTGQVTNLFGRPRRIPEAKDIIKLYGNRAHADLPYAARTLLNLAVNHRIQSTGASIVNRAAIRFHENCKLAGIDAKLVLQVHDSLISECAVKDAQDVCAILQDAMENTVTLEGISLEAIPKIGSNLSGV